ncbi:hypothetical protein GCM10009528_04330 [Kineococcus aurantiacus]
MYTARTRCVAAARADRAARTDPSAATCARTLALTAVPTASSDRTSSARAACTCATARCAATCAACARSRACAAVPCVDPCVDPAVDSAVDPCVVGVGPGAAFADPAAGPRVRSAASPSPSRAAGGPAGAGRGRRGRAGGITQGSSARHRPVLSGLAIAGGDQAVTPICSSGTTTHRRAPPDGEGSPTARRVTVPARAADAEPGTTPETGGGDCGGTG